jgi:branched-chain amino acid aminotransferase
MNEPIVYLAGAILPQSRAALALHDSGFVLGVTVTDLARTYRGALFRWEDHLARFHSSCRAAHLKVPISDAELTSFVHQIVAFNHSLLPPGGELCAVLFATPGPIGYYVGLTGGAGDGATTLGFYTHPLPFARLRDTVHRGAHLVVPTIRQIPRSVLDPAIKHRSRMHWWLAEREAHAMTPGAAPLLLDESGHVTESPSANFVLVRNGVLQTPLAGKVLPGISLSMVRELACAENIPFEERDLSLEDCLAASEAFLTNTSYGIAGVRRLNEREFPVPGPITRRLLDAWSAKTGVPIHEGF